MFNHIITKLREIFSHKREIDSKLYRSKILSFFYAREWDYVTTITDVKVYLLQTGSIEIEFTTHRPGLLIGKQGRFIDSLKEHLESQFEVTIFISIKESQLWHKLY